MTEPGIIPRNHPDYIKKDEQKQEDKNEQEGIKPRIFTERECTTCNIIRPPGASHCSDCDNCVLDFDHHCAFISNCVGKRNHKSTKGSSILSRNRIINNIKKFS